MSKSNHETPTSVIRREWYVTVLEQCGLVWRSLSVNSTFLWPSSEFPTVITSATLSQVGDYVRHSSQVGDYVRHSVFKGPSPLALCFLQGPRKGRPGLR